MQQTNPEFSVVYLTQQFIAFSPKVWCASEKGCPPSGDSRIKSFSILYCYHFNTWLLRFPWQNKGESGGDISARKYLSLEVIPITFTHTLLNRLSHTTLPSCKETRNCNLSQDQNKANNWTWESTSSLPQLINTECFTLSRADCKWNLARNFNNLEASTKFLLSHLSWKKMVT